MSRKDPRGAKHYYKPADTVMCIHCGNATENHPDGRPRLYCSDKCRVYAHRAKNRRARAGIEPQEDR